MKTLLLVLALLTTSPSYAQSFFIQTLDDDPFDREVWSLLYAMSESRLSVASRDSADAIIAFDAMSIQDGEVGYVISISFLKSERFIDGKIFFDENKFVAIARAFSWSYDEWRKIQVVMIDAGTE